MFPKIVQIIAQKINFSTKHRSSKRLNVFKGY